MATHARVSKGIQKQRKRRPNHKAPVVAGGFVCVNKMMNSIIGRVISKARLLDLAREYSRTHRKEQLAWRQTPAGQSYHKRNRESDASRASQSKYRKTDKCKAVRVRFVSKASNRIANAFSSRLSQIVKGSKSTKSILYTGFSTSKQLMDHLATRFENGMNRENYGKEGWVVDHMIPRILYDHEDEEEIFRCWNSCNLRPCWDRNNSSKGAKLFSEMVDQVPPEYWPKSWKGVRPV